MFNRQCKSLSAEAPASYHQAKRPDATLNKAIVTITAEN